MVKSEKISVDKKGNITGVRIDKKIEILEREVTNFGTGGHVLIPKKHIGKKAKIILTE